MQALDVQTADGKQVLTQEPHVLVTTVRVTGQQHVVDTRVVLQKGFVFVDEVIFWMKAMA